MMKGLSRLRLYETDQSQRAIGSGGTFVEPYFDEVSVKYVYNIYLIKLI